MRSLVRHHWPGNHSESSQNYVARGVILSNDASLNQHLSKAASRRNPRFQTHLEDKVRREILAACQRANWKLGGPRGQAARLGLSAPRCFTK